MRFKCAFLLAAAGLSLSACATPTAYQPMVPQKGGYSEERLSENQFKVMFAGNPHTPPERVSQFLLRRAAELTLAEGYDWFRVTNRATEANVRTIQTSRGPVRVSDTPGYGPWRNYGGFYTRSGFKLFTPLWRHITGRAGGEALEASAEIVLGRGPAPQGENVFEAKKVLGELNR
ncbi:MAG TPA: hypothetical protein VNT25_02440 [Allosphingosinicella sp.]|nr:hypothetical protein [Allosphingosinicella sp.]